MSVVLVQSAAVKVCLKRWHRRENTSEYSWHFNQSSSHSAAEDRKLLLLLFCYAFLRNTQEEKENCLFLNYSLSLQTTNPFKDSESQPQCALSQSKGTQNNPIKVQPKERTSFFTCFSGWQHFDFHLATQYSAQFLIRKRLEKLNWRNSIFSKRVRTSGCSSVHILARSLLNGVVYTRCSQ